MNPKYKVEVYGDYIYFGVFESFDNSEHAEDFKEIAEKTDQGNIKKILLDIKTNHDTVNPHSLMQGIKYMEVLTKYDKIAFSAADEKMRGYCEAAIELLKVKNFIISGKHTYGVFSNKEEAVVFLES